MHCINFERYGGVVVPGTRYQVLCTLQLLLSKHPKSLIKMAQWRNLLLKIDVSAYSTSLCCVLHQNSYGQCVFHCIKPRGPNGVILVSNSSWRKFLETKLMPIFRCFLVRKIPGHIVQNIARLHKIPSFEASINSLTSSCCTLIEPKHASRIVVQVLQQGGE
jgi:hypothetical protein